jgi:hypothetical protein
MVNAFRQIEPLTQEEQDWLEYEAWCNNQDEESEQEYDETMSALYDNYAY